MNICITSSEVAPFAKTGGLADVSSALAKYLNKSDHDVRVILPFYSAIDTRKFDFVNVEFADDSKTLLAGREVHYKIFTTQLKGSDTQYYFVHCPQFFERPFLYTNDPDEHLRFALLSKAAIELCQKMGWAPDIFHCNDWQTAIIPIFLKTIYNRDQLFKKTKSLLTIHNVAYQGSFPARIINEIGLAEYHNWFHKADLYYGKLNYLKTGVIHADMINTVSETYAIEIQTEYFGEGLQDMLKQRADVLHGILNGVDYEEWNPETDTHIPYNYSVKSITGKERNKKVLLKQLGLKYHKSTPVLGMITRLTDQKGIELVQGCIENILKKHEIRLVVLGNGEPDFEHYFYFLQLQYPEKVVFFKGYDIELSHLIEAGADIFIMPSRFEPCGLNQIYSLKYGTVPVVRKTGGLADTVQLYDWETQKGTGFVFEHYNAESLEWALEYAITTFKNKTAWRKLMKQGMKMDFSWEHQIEFYLKLYEEMILSDA